MDYLIFWEWLSFAARWLHVITAIAWIGSSFYFIALDLGLRRHAALPAGVNGEEWQVHGGGFYHIQKYMVAPAHMPEHLIWFKWESYATWLSGFALLCIVYYAGADLYLIDRNVLDVSTWVAILISLASISIGWLIYDLLCKSPLAANDTALMLILYGVIVFMAWGYTHLFTGRAAFLHLGAFTATIMSANVFLLIIPNQKKVVADLIAGKSPDPKLGKQAKQRSTHNNYLTLPVIFLMLSNHYPLATSTAFNWIIASLVFIIGVLIRHYFNSRHAGKGNPHWTWLASAILFIVIIWLSTVPRVLTGEAKVSRAAEPFLTAAHFEQVRDTVLGRCSMCHSAEPSWEGIMLPPKGVRLDTDGLIAAHASEIYIQAGASHAMPPGNVTQVTDAERALLVAWYRSATAGKPVQ
ncbi:urate hydroxylase PuuD [Phyllobacterium sp. UNC302MFCol5.2]|uniref:urate hydroxylase PuuD n=1 Tax=Phyllobacterium sp. UNC302MFCol5.2 TaxID=1449065 RepID=UPI000485CBF2|nr:urate hydroxylase PuuD [Phyllobacterium sp. UNC302MFCol5.2]